MRKAAVGIKCDVRKYTYFVVVFLQLLLSEFGNLGKMVEYILHLGGIFLRPPNRPTVQISNKRKHTLSMLLSVLSKINF